MHLLMIYVDSISVYAACRSRVFRLSSKNGQSRFQDCPFILLIMRFFLACTCRKILLSVSVLVVTVWNLNSTMVRLHGYYSRNLLLIEKSASSLLTEKPILRNYKTIKTEFSLSHSMKSMHLSRLVKMTA